MPATNFNILTGLTVGNVTTDATNNSVATSGNITAGNLASTGLASAATLLVSGTSNLGAIGNITITGGAANRVITTNGSGVLSFTDVTTLTGTVSSATANQLAYYTGSTTVSGHANLTWTGGNLLTVTGNISSTNISASGEITITGNANVGNIGATNANLSAATITGNLATGNTSAVLFTGNVSGVSGVFSGNATFGNINSVSGILGVSGNITGGNLITTGFLSASGNANVGNIGANNAVFTSISGTLTTAAQPNITSTGTLSSLTISGNVTAQANVLVTSNITAGNINSVSGILSVTGNANVGNIGATNANITSMTATGSVFMATTSGNVGIGTTSPAVILDLGGGTNFVNGVTSYTGISPTAKTIQIYDATQSFLNLVSGVNTAGAVLGGIFFSRSLGQSDAHYNVAGITALQNSTGTISGGELLFYTKANSSPTEKMRINVTGDIIFGNGESSATTTAATLRGPARTGTNAAGSNLTIATGNGTGTGGSGSLIFQTASAGSSGTTANTLSERMRIDSSGNVGIGTASPKQLLHVAGQGLFTTSGSSYDPGDSAGSAVRIGYITGGDYGYVICNQTGVASKRLLVGGSTIEFLVSGAEKGRFNSDGKFGIGTTSPLTTLQVGAVAALNGDVTLSAGTIMVYTVATSGAALTWNANTNGGNTNTVMARLQPRHDTSGNYCLDVFCGTWNNNNSAGTAIATFSSSGNVGIGTTSPAVALDVVRASADSQVRAYTGTVDLRMWAYHAGAGVIGTNSAHPLIFAADSLTERMRITTAGNVGIGTTSPSKKGSVGTAGTDGFAIQYSPTSQEVFSVTANTGTGETKFFCDTNYFQTFYTNNSEKMRVNTDGYLLVGYTSSNGSYKLQVNSQIFATDPTIATSDGRYKQNVVSLQSGLDVIEKLNPVTFNWKDHDIHNFESGTQVGFIAQEVKEVLADTPYLDSVIKRNELKRDDGSVEEFYGMADAKLIPVLVKAIQELKAEIDLLKAGN
jgi:hypothetical protein